MDWWTIFYWAWWITWAPFVGFFVALISRGRTVREVIVGGFVCPTLFAIIWFSVFGGLAIKMERVAEIALQVRPDHAHAAVQCGEHYSGSHPITPEAKKLAAAGYRMLTCMPRDDQIYWLMGPYANLTEFLWFFLWCGLVIYFLTSSDSGSMTDDIISASGLSASKIPYWQKIFWCWTEGFAAIALTSGAAGAISSLQAASIILGLPYTLILCMMVPALWRALKKEAGDEDIISSYRFNTQLMDFLEFFKPKGGSPCAPMVHVKCIITGIFLPFLGVMKGYTFVYPEQNKSGIFFGALAQIGWFTWFIFMIIEVEVKNLSIIGWIGYITFALLIGFIRGEMRGKEKIWGSPVDDFWCGLVLWPLALAQIQVGTTTL